MVCDMIRSIEDNAVKIISEIFRNGGSYTTDMIHMLSSMKDN